MAVKVWTSTIKTLEKLGYKVRKHEPNMNPDGLGQLYALEYNGFLYSEWMSANELNYFAAGASRAMHVLNVDQTSTDDCTECACDCEGKCEQHCGATVSTKLDEAVDQFFDYLECTTVRTLKADAQ